MRMSRWIVAAALVVVSVVLYQFLPAASSPEPAREPAGAPADAAQPSTGPGLSRSERLSLGVPAPAESRPALERPTSALPSLAAPSPAPERRSEAERERPAVGRPVGAAAGRASRMEQPEESTGDPRAVRNCQLSLIDEAEVPAQEAGVLKELKVAVRGRDGKLVLKDGAIQWGKEVKEGIEVAQGDLLGQIDDTQARMAKDIADYKYAAAAKEGENDVSVRHASKLFDLSKVELESGLATDRKAPGAMSLYDLRRMRFKCEESSLQIEQSQHELDVNKLKAAVSQAEAKAASNDIERRRIESPLSGMVVKRYRHVGEWVKPGDPVLRILRLDRLRIQAFLDSDKLSPAEVDGRRVTVRLNVQGRPRAFAGVIVFANPTIESDRKFQVHAEVENEKDSTGHWVLLPGQRVEMTIDR